RPEGPWWEAALDHPNVVLCRPLGQWPRRSVVWAIAERRRHTRCIRQRRTAAAVALPREPRVQVSRRSDDGGAASRPRSLDVVVQLELVRVRAQLHGQDLVGALVVDPRLDEVV